MLSLKAINLFICLMASVLLAVGCQKAARHPIKGQLAAAGQTKSTEVLAADKKIDDVIASKKIIDCTSQLIDTNASLALNLDKANQFLLDHKEIKKLDPSVIKSAVQISNDISSESEIIIKELINASASACSMADKMQIQLIDVKANSQNLIISIANKIGQETPESIKARIEKKRLASNAPSTTPTEPENLVLQVFKISKDFALVLDQAHQEQSVFFMNGVIQTTKEKLAQALIQLDQTVCTIETAPSVKLVEEAQATVVSVNLAADKNKKSKNLQMLVSMTAPAADQSGDLTFSLSCRLASNLKLGSVAVQFKKALGAQIQAAP